jgi:hypothetical protein
VIVAVQVCVDFADLLQHTAVVNRDQFDRFLVVTHPEDYETLQVVKDLHLECITTETFYDNGAAFNKWAAMQEGLDYVSHAGWTVLLDSDVFFPAGWRSQIRLQDDKIFCPRRRSVRRIHEVPEERHWRRVRQIADEPFAGYALMFNRSSQYCPPVRLFRSDLEWAGTGDQELIQHWPAAMQVRPGFEVMHVGELKQNWAGRVQQFVDGERPRDWEDRLSMQGAIERQMRLVNRVDFQYR